MHGPPQLLKQWEAPRSILDEFKYGALQCCMRMSHEGWKVESRAWSRSFLGRVIGCYPIQDIYFIIYYDILLWILLVVLGFSVPVMCSCSAAVA